ncbi:MAG: LysM peptidoglycan-binding domain-containing protein [Kiritimatiellae bacterium]|nr:LysM peptidoglycan-binding domain-containing protein [Kiritimatiellia bacterium]
MTNFKKPANGWRGTLVWLVGAALLIGGATAAQEDEGKEESPGKTTPNLEDVLRRAKEWEFLVEERKKLKAEIEQLQADLAAERARAAELDEKNAGLRADLETAGKANQTLKEKIEGLRNTIREWLYGKIELYEVWEGDTLESIAADPLVYGDKKKADWIRRANEGRVKNLDKLRAGDVLLVPSFQPDRKYEFW